MGQVRYLEERVRKSGKKVYIINPPTYIRDALSVGYEQYEDKIDAVDRAEKIYLAYQDHKRGQSKDIRIQHDTVDGLIAFYKSTNAYLKLANSSKKSYHNLIRVASDTRLGQSNVNFGGMLAKNVSPTHADTLYSTIKRVKGDHKAFHVIKVLKKVWFVGKRHGIVQFNSFERMGLTSPKSRTTLWEPEQVDLFIKTADSMGLESVGTIALLCYHLCQRPGDIRQLKWSNFNGDTFRFIQEKTSTEVEITASEAVIDRISSKVGITADYIILSERTGRIHTMDSPSLYAREILKEAGLPLELQIRDLRRTGATETAEAGASEDELRAITGHKSRDVLSIYVRPTRKLAKNGMMKRFGK